MEEQLFGKCEKLKDLYMKYNILEYEKVFNSNITIERLNQKSEAIIICIHARVCLCVYVYICMCACVDMKF